MKRLIDANKLKDRFESWEWYSGGMVKSMINHAPTVKAEVAIKALENQSFDVDEYRRRLVDKYSEGDKATDVDNGITIALDLLDEMEEETT